LKIRLYYAVSRHNKKLLLIGISAGKTRDEIMDIFQRHKAFLDQFIAVVRLFE
jgi:hypothetical protein